jgi:starch synthase
MTAPSLRALFATSECAPWSKTGGLGDVSASLPAALVAQGIDVRVLTPAYPPVLERAHSVEAVAEVDASAHFPSATVLQATLPSGVAALLVECPALYYRPGGPYQDTQGNDWADNATRFGFLSYIAATLSGEASPLDWRPHVLHCNDWQTGLAPAYVRYAPGRSAATVMSIHNLAFQGQFDGDRTAELGLPREAFAVDGLEFHGRTSFLKAGLFYATALSTVSPTYATEIQRAPLGFGLEGLIASRRAALTGILNGIDTDVWNPSTDALLPQRYDTQTLDLKSRNKAALQTRMGLDVDPAIPLFGVVSRLTLQKGSDLIAALAPAIASMPAQLAILGSGEKAHERALVDAARAHPRNIAIAIAFDEGLAHLIEGGADAFLMPSRFEPSGLNQMYSQRYGTPPIATSTGGLVDSIVDATDETLADGTATGFLFDGPDAATLRGAMQRALAVYADRDAWRRMQREGMAQDFEWSRSAREYASLYRRIATV